MRKLKHVTIPVDESHESQGKVINLMDALRRSVGEPTKRKKPVVRANGKPANGKAGKAALQLVQTSPRSGDKRRKSA